MTIGYCENCGHENPMKWEEAFDKFGYMDGKLSVFSYDVEEALNEAGHETYLIGNLHNTIITSIKKDGKELMPVDDENFRIGSSNPRTYLPSEIIDLLDEVFECEEYA